MKKVNYIVEQFFDIKIEGHNTILFGENTYNYKDAYVILNSTLFNVP